MAVDGYCTLYGKAVNSTVLESPRGKAQAICSAISFVQTWRLSNRGCFDFGSRAEVETGEILPWSMQVRPSSASLYLCHSVAGSVSVCQAVAPVCAYRT